MSRMIAMMITIATFPDPMVSMVSSSTKERGTTPVTATRMDTKTGSRIRSSSHKAKIMLGIGLVLTPTELLCYLVTCRDETLVDSPAAQCEHNANASGRGQDSWEDDRDQYDIREPGHR
ncbi:hypothetical protein E4U19_007438 [Claviceps sp. Clav32 group G5]|nr:hypothetical protein E4U19_007438 [Claviceps sp. Clav32 group G5]